MVLVKTTTPLTTGVADWRLSHTRGKHIAGRARVTDAHANWVRENKGRWLGSSINDWPPGVAEFTLAFQVTAPHIAEFELLYAADNRVESATLNGHPLRLDGQKGCRALSLLRAPRNMGLFVDGVNVLVIHVRAGSTTPAEVKEVWASGSKASGLKWRNVGSSRPEKGSRLNNAKLEEALPKKADSSGKVDLTASEWRAFDVKELSMDHFVKAGDAYFQPVEPLLERRPVGQLVSSGLYPV
jgi:hypothetical protein